jgi:hypothetical protein
LAFASFASKKRPGYPGPFRHYASARLVLLIAGLVAVLVVIRILLAGLARLAALALLLTGLLTRLWLVLALLLLIVLTRLIVLVGHVVLQTWGYPAQMMNPYCAASFRRNPKVPGVSWFIFRQLHKQSAWLISRLQYGMVTN